MGSSRARNLPMNMPGIVRNVAQQGFMQRSSTRQPNPNAMNPNQAQFQSPNPRNSANLNQSRATRPNPNNSMNLGNQGMRMPSNANSLNLNQQSHVNASAMNQMGSGVAIPPRNVAGKSELPDKGHASIEADVELDESKSIEREPIEEAKKPQQQIKGLADSLLGSSSPKNVVDPAFLPQQIERRNVFKENPNVYYLNGESLSRPLAIPPDIKKKRWIFVGIAVIIACLMLFFYFDQIVSAPARTEAEMHEMLSRDVATNPPDLLKMLSMTDKKIKSSLSKTATKNDYAILDLSSDKTPTEMNLVKIPSDVTEEEGSELYSQGLNNLNALQLVSLLNGGWDLNVDRTSGLNISLHYADFKSNSPSSAIAQAIAAEGLSRGTTSETGDDDGFGNYFSTGSIMINNIDYAWTVSSTYLSEVYPVSGIPDTATYVGVRIIRKAAYN